MNSRPEMLPIPPVHPARRVASWVVGVAIFLASMQFADLLGRSLGVPVQLHFSEPFVVHYGPHDVERDSAFTTFGFAISILCIMLASRSGMAVASSSLRGGMDAKGELQFLAWAYGLAIYAVIGMLLYRAGRGLGGVVAQVLFNVLDVAFAVGIAWAMKQWHDLRLRKLSKG